MNKKLADFLDDVCSLIRCKEVHSDIRNELKNHIEELKDEYTNEGYNEDTALSMAIDAMGNRVEIGIELDKKHRPKTEWSLILLTAIIASIGSIIIYLSSEFIDYGKTRFENHIFFLMFGIVAMIVIFFFNYTKLRNISWPLYIIALSLLNVILYKGNGQAVELVIVGPNCYSLSCNIAFTSSLCRISRKCKR